MKLLVVRRDNIGDLVCATPLIAALRKRYPDAHIAALVNSYNAGVLHGNPDVNAVHAYTKLKHRRPGQSAIGIVRDRFRMLAQLRRGRFDYVVLAKAQFDRHGLALARWIAPRHIVGVAPASGRGAKRITDPVPPIPFADLHEVEAMMKLAAPFGVDEAPGPLRVFAAPELAARWRERFPALGERRAEVSARAEQQHEHHACDDRRDAERQVDQAHEQVPAAEPEPRDRPRRGDAEHEVERHGDQRDRDGQPDRGARGRVLDCGGVGVEALREREVEDRRHR